MAGSMRQPSRSIRSSIIATRPAARRPCRNTASRAGSAALICVISLQGQVSVLSTSAPPRSSACASSMRRSG
jgi:hypothetical protein